MKRRTVLKSIATAMAFAVLPKASIARDSKPLLPGYRLKGFKIFDENGKHICDLAKDIVPYSVCSREDFTNWSIPVPELYTPIHPAILKWVNPA